MTGRSPEETILKSALKVVDAKTISGTRMHLIAKEAGMSQSNLHYHFRTKKELLLALLHYLQKQFSEDRENDLKNRADSLKQKLGGFFDQKKSIILREPEYDRVQFDFWSLGQVDPEINGCFQKSFNIWRENISEIIHFYVPELDENNVRTVSEIMVSMMMGATMQYLNLETPVGLEEYFTICEQMICWYLEKGM